MVIRGMKNSVNLFNKETQRKNIRKWVLTHKYTPSIGRIVLAAPGSGKSKYIETNSDWIDADEIMRDLGIHNLKWHDNNYGPNTPQFKQHYTLCDQMLEIMKEEGLQVLGALFWEFEADAIVNIDLKLHQQYVAQRTDLNWNTVEMIRNELLTLAKTKKIMVYDTFEKACQNRPLFIKSLSMSTT